MVGNPFAVIVREKCGRVKRGPSDLAGRSQLCLYLSASYVPRNSPTATILLARRAISHSRFNLSLSRDVSCGTPPNGGAKESIDHARIEESIHRASLQQGSGIPFDVGDARVYDNETLVEFCTL